MTVDSIRIFGFPFRVSCCLSFSNLWFNNYPFGPLGERQYALSINSLIISEVSFFVKYKLENSEIFFPQSFPSVLMQVLWFLLSSPADQLDSTFFTLFQPMYIFLNKWFLLSKPQWITLTFSRPRSLPHGLHICITHTTQSLAHMPEWNVILQLPLEHIFSALVPHIRRQICSCYFLNTDSNTFTSSRSIYSIR